MNNRLLSRIIRYKGPTIIAMLVAGAAGAAATVSTSQTTPSPRVGSDAWTRVLNSATPAPPFVLPTPISTAPAPQTGDTSTANTYANLVLSNSQTVESDVLGVDARCNVDGTSPDCATAMTQMQRDTQAFLSALATTQVPGEYATANAQLSAGLQELINAGNAYQQWAANPTTDSTAFQSDVTAAADDFDQAANSFDAVGA